jgi:dethiobiotin synthetase
LFLKAFLSCRLNYFVTHQDNFLTYVNNFFLRTLNFMTHKSIYVAATSQHVGKTTATLGLVSAIRNKGINVGYCKPVGQRYVYHNGLQVDKDVVLFGDLLGFQPNPALHSPVILGSGATTDYIDHPENFYFSNDIINASTQLKKLHQLVIFEGTGHPGVGSVVDQSNGDVARLTGSGVIMIAEGGIGSTIDQLSMCMEKFFSHNVPILGVILNKVIEEKREKVAHYVSKWLDKLDIPLLGTMPFDRTMGFPLLRTIMDSVKGNVIYNAHNLNNMVDGFIAGSLISSEEFRGKGENLLLVVGVTRLDLAIEGTIKVMEALDLKKPPISGIIATGEGGLSSFTADFVKHYQIPLIHTMLETYGAVVKIARIEVKINPETPWKVQRAIEMIEQNINLDLILEKSKI